MSFPCLKSVSYEELKRHSSYSDAWICLDGVVYDITRFISKHPFGDTFRGNLGSDCSGLFASAHFATKVGELISDPAFLARYEIVVIGELDVSSDRLHRTSENRYLDRIVYERTDADPFWGDLRGEVAAFLAQEKEDTHYTVREGYVYLAYYSAIYVILGYLTWIQGYHLAAALLGVHMVCASANIAHMATHFGFTRSRSLNFLAVHFFDLCGMSGLEWQITHQTHHNQPHSSIDHQTNSYDTIGMRIHRYTQRKSHHRFQPIYFWLVISLYLVFKLFSTTAWLFANRQFARPVDIAAHLVARLVLLAQVACCAYLHGGWTAMSVFAVYAVACSQSAFILLYNNVEQTHYPLGEVEDVAEFHGRLSWAKTQVRTSSNWYPTNWLLSFIEFHYGYFNYHIEHHLFPTLKPRLLKKISPIVRQVCAKHGVPYVSTPFMSVQSSLQRHITNLSRTDSNSRAPSHN